MKLPPLILASASPRRAELLKLLPVKFRVLPGHAAEVAHEHLSPLEICQLNAHRKARAVAKQIPDALVLAADTLVFLDNEILGKPRDLVEARKMITRLQGRHHQVVTGVCLMHLRRHRERIFAVSTDVLFHPLNARQIAAFMAALETFPGKPASVANSSGVFLASKPHLDLVRPGYALYGGNPTPGRPNPMRSVVTLEAPILQVREISVGETVGYNAQWSAPRPSRLATIGLGYADGLPRSAVWTKDKRGGEAIVGGVRCPFAGRISMDLTVLDVTDVPDGAAIPGAPARLLGPEIGVDELGARAGTIGYEILTSLGQRYHRVYVGG